MTYLPAMVAGHAMLGGIIHYICTGKRPDELKDYLFPEIGIVDKYGQPVRVAIADFVKDAVADIKSVATGNPMEIAKEQVRKLAPMWNMFGEMAKNEDFYGTKIFSEPKLGDSRLEHLWTTVREGAEYLGKTALPFSVRAAGKLGESSDAVFLKLAPFLGIIPAPRYAVQTPAEAYSAEKMRDSLPREGMSQEQRAHAQAVSDLVRDLRKGTVKEDQIGGRLRAAGVRDQAELTRISQRTVWQPMQYQVHRLPLHVGMATFDLANDAERVSLAPILADKIDRQYDQGLVDEETAHRYAVLVMPYLKKALGRNRN